VRSPVEVLPRPAIFLSAFRWEAETKKSVVTVVNRDESPLEILGNRRDGDRFTVELTVSKERFQRGKFQGTIRIFTNDEEFPELLIPVRVEVE